MGSKSSAFGVRHMTKFSIGRKRRIGIIAASLLTAMLTVDRVTAYGAPPPGINPNSDEHQWWECHRQPLHSDVPCCSESDGHVLSDSEWRITSHGYQIKVEKRWFDVPPKAVLNDTSACGPEPDAKQSMTAKVWYILKWDYSLQDDMVLQVEVLCFEAGVLY
jgi:hypothetical protein